MEVVDMGKKHIKNRTEGNEENAVFCEMCRRCETAQP
jgi:hypothetical protein